MKVVTDLWYGTEKAKVKLNFFERRKLRKAERLLDRINAKINKMMLCGDNIDSKTANLQSTIKNASFAVSRAFRTIENSWM